MYLLSIHRTSLPSSRSLQKSQTINRLAESRHCRFSLRIRVVSRLNSPLCAFPVELSPSLMSENREQWRSQDYLKGGEVSNIN